MDTDFGWEIIENSRIFRIFLKFFYEFRKNLILSSAMKSESSLGEFQNQSTYRGKKELGKRQGNHGKIEDSLSVSSFY